MSIKPSHLVILTAVLCGLAAPSRAQPAQSTGEQLIAPIPPEFKFAGRLPRDGAQIRVYFPVNQTEEDWTEQLVTMIYLNQRSGDPVSVLHAMEKAWKEACKDSDPIKILPGKTNGYTTATTLLKCPLMPATGKPETGLVHVIKGNDNTYLVQRNARHLFKPDEVKQLIRYMGTVAVCDSRTPDHPCKKQPGPDAKPTP